MTSAPSWSHRQHGLTGTGEMQLPGAHVPGQGLLQRKILVLKSVIRRKWLGVSVAIRGTACSGSAGGCARFSHLKK